MKTGTFPVQCNFRSTPPVSADESFKKKWIELTAIYKRELTLLWVDEMNRKYASVKLEIQSTLAEIESHLDPKQLNEIQDSLNIKFKTAAPVSLEKKLRTSYQQRPPQSKTDRRNKPFKRPQNQDRQLKMLLNGLTKLIHSVSCIGWGTQQAQMQLSGTGAKNYIIFGHSLHSTQQASTCLYEVMPSHCTPYPGAPSPLCDSNLA